MERLESADGTARAWGWVAHLRDGGTTPWSAWLDEATPSGRVLPGAQQLELLRRLNLAESSAGPRSAGSPVSARLADRVLNAAAPGRGKPDLSLVGVAPRAYGPQPVDPGELPADELIRVATSVLADDVVALGVPTPTRHLRRPWRRPHRLVGDPLEAAQVREHLARRGQPPGGPGAPVLVLGGPLDQMLVDVWTRRCFERGSGGWLEWLRFWQQRGSLPPRIDLPAVVQRHQDRHVDVRVVLDQARLPSLLGVRRLPPPSRPRADAAELARRIASVLGLLVSTDQRAALMTHTVLPRMPATSTPPVSLPEEHRGWVVEAAERMCRTLSRSGYPVVGDPSSIVPAESAAPAAPAVARGELVLDLAVGMLVDPRWKTSHDTKEPR
ncbi:hypothetical protein [Nocardioides piscis]|uniref:Uncharacterized protein n=1 Tax=Nocardioides piscis TaxID=2714938 RepID=A0A6G7YDJ8_9ACTN|nr:hypothetical protein [Nocardioides piscis]QIK74850.1 hypothetical protein G7071_04805 [Nocardioides piscis]